MNDAFALPMSRQARCRPGAVIGLMVALGGCAWFGSFEHTAAKLTARHDSCRRCDWTETSRWPISAESFWTRSDTPADEKYDSDAMQETSRAGEVEAQDCARELAREAGPRSRHPPEMLRAIMIIGCMERRGWELEVLQEKVTVTH